MLRAYKYRIYPNAAQRELIEQHFGACRLVYNLALGPPLGESELSANTMRACKPQKRSDD